MDALEKSKLHERKWLPVEQIVKNERNPNKMSTREFDLLVDNISQKGATEDIEVRQIGENLYRIIGGHHRYEACKYLGWVEVPCLINRDPDLDDDEEIFQLVRMNVIKGKLDPAKFLDLYKKMSSKYEDELLQSMFGFSDDKEFQKLIREAKAGLPKELQAAFDDAVKEVKTIEDLAKVLNDLLSNYGSTLEYGYMIFDFGGKQSVWLRMKKQDLDVFSALALTFSAENRAMDDVVMTMFDELLTDKELRKRVLDATPHVDKTLANHQSMGQMDASFANEL